MKPWTGIKNGAPHRAENQLKRMRREKRLGVFYFFFFRAFKNVVSAVAPPSVRRSHESVSRVRWPRKRKEGARGPVPAYVRRTDDVWTKAEIGKDSQLCRERQIWKLVEFCLFRYYKQRVNQQDFIFSNINTSRVLQQVFWNQAHTFLDKFEFGNHFRILMSKFPFYIGACSILFQNKNNICKRVWGCSELMKML